MTMLPSGFGIGIPHQRAENDSTWYEHALETLQPPWWYNWKSDCMGAESYVPMVWKCAPDRVHAASADGQQLWLLGNEPEASTQSNTDPETFAAAVRTAVRPYALPGVLWHWQGEGRDWLDAYLATDSPLPDVWHMHIYAYSARNWLDYLDEVQRYLGAIADVPLIISECASWSSATNAEVMDAVRLAVDTGRVQAAAWFSAYYDAWEAPSLLTKGGWKTELGRQYRRHEVNMPLVMR